MPVKVRKLRGKFRVIEADNGAEAKGIIAKLSGLPVDQIDPHATFLELGFDSLFLTQANAAFKKAFKLKLRIDQSATDTNFIVTSLTFRVKETDQQ